MNKFILSICAVLATGIILVGAKASPTPYLQAQKKVYTEEEFFKKVAEVRKEADAKVAKIQKDADDRVAAAEADAKKRIDEVNAAAEEKMKKMVADAGVQELGKFNAEKGKWYAVENSEGLMRFRDPAWEDFSGSKFTIEVEVPDQRLGGKDENRSGIADMIFYVQLYDKDQKPLRRKTVYLQDVTARGGRYCLEVPLTVSNAAFYSLRFNGSAPIRYNQQ